MLQQTVIPAAFYQRFPASVCIPLKNNPRIIAVSSNLSQVKENMRLTPITFQHLPDFPQPFHSCQRPGILCQALRLREYFRTSKKLGQTAENFFQLFRKLQILTEFLHSKPVFIGNQGTHSSVIFPFQTCLPGQSPEKIHLPHTDLKI